MHIDEIDHDQAAEVPYAQLAGDFVGGFQVGIQCGFLNIAALGGAGGVDVDGNQCLGMVDHDGAAGWQGDFALEGGFDLGFDLEAAEKRNGFLVKLQLVPGCAA